MGERTRAQVCVCVCVIVWSVGCGEVGTLVKAMWTESFDARIFAAPGSQLTVNPCPYSFIYCRLVSIIVRQKDAHEIAEAGSPCDRKPCQFT